MSVDDLVSPEHIKKEVERVFNTIVSNCGNVHLDLRYIPYRGQAGGEDILGGEGAPVVVLTIPQLEGAWQKVFTTFLDPWFRFPQIKNYIQKNDLTKFLVQDDCETKSQIWLQFKDLLVNWGYNEIMNALATRFSTIQSTVTKPVTKPAKPEQTKPKTKPIHKNSAVVGTAVATPIIAALSALYHVLPAPVGTAIVGIIAFVLSVIEHTSYKQIIEEVEK